MGARLFRILAPPRWVLAAGALLVVLAAGLVWRFVGIESGCEARIARLETVLAQSNADLVRSPDASIADRCNIYRSRVDALAGISAAKSICVTPLTLKADVWRNQDAERRTYQNLIEQTCPPVG